MLAVLPSPRHVKTHLWASCFCCQSLSCHRRAKAGISAAADGTLAAKSNNPFAAPGTDAAGSAPEPTQGSVDEGDIEAEGVESALVSLERVTAVLTLNAGEGISLGMKVAILDIMNMHHNRC